jgi:hypothetical protein
LLWRWLGVLAVCITYLAINDLWRSVLSCNSPSVLNQPSVYVFSQFIIVLVVLFYLQHGSTGTDRCARNQTNRSPLSSCSTYRMVAPVLIDAREPNGYPQRPKPWASIPSRLRARQRTR